MDELNESQDIQAELRSHKKVIRKNALWLFFGEMIGRVFRLAVTILPAKLISKESWGGFNYVLSVVTLLTALADIGISVLITREANKHPESKKQYLSTAFFIKLGLITALGIVFAVISNVFADDPEIKVLAPLMLFIFVFDSLRDFGTAIARANERMEKEGLNDIMTNVFIASFGLLFLYLNPSAFSIALAYAIGTGLGLISIALAVREDIKYLFHNFNRSLMKHIALSAWPFGALGLMGILMVNTDVFIIKWLLSLKEVALYAAPQKLIQVLYIIPGFVSSAFFPALAKYTKEPAKFRHLFENALSVVMMIAVPLAFGSIVLATPIINFLYNSSFYASVLTFRILALTIISVAMSVAISNVIYAHGREKGYILVSFIGIFGNLFLDLLLIPKWGIAGSAVATLISQIFINTYAFYKAKQLVTFRILGRAAKIFLAALLMSVLAYMMNHLGVNLIINVILSAMAYICWLILLKEESLRDFWGLTARGGGKS